MKIKLNSTHIFAYLAFALIMFLDWSMFKTYVIFEKSWSPFLNGDANMYLSQSYRVFDYILNNHKLPENIINDHTGFMIFVVSSLFYVLFGASRLSAISINFVFFLIYLSFLFFAIRRISNSWVMSFTAIGLGLSMGVPFLTSDVNPMLSIGAYQRDFVGFCLFGSFLSAVLVSKTFLNFRWSLIAGVLAGLTIVFRYHMVFPLIAIFLTNFFFIFVFKNWMDRKNKDVSDLKIQIKNSIYSFFAMLLTIVIPISLGFKAIFNKFFLERFVNLDKDWLEAYGIQNFIEKLIYYPKSVFYGGLGTHFFDVLAHVVMLLAFLVILYFILRYWNNPIGNKKFDRDKKEKGILTLSLFVFLCVSLIVPLFILNVAPNVAWNVATFLTTPLILFICIVLAVVYKKFIVSEIGISRVVGFLIAITAVSEGMLFHMKSYSQKSNSSHHRQSYESLAALYDDIVVESRKLNENFPKLSSNFMENYLLGGAAALGAYQYEKTGEFFQPRPNLGGGNVLYRNIKIDEVISKIKDSDFAVISMAPIMKNSKKVNCDPLQKLFAGSRFSKSIRKYDSAISEVLKEGFSKKGKYLICGRTLGLYVRKGEHAFAGPLWGQPPAIPSDVIFFEEFSKMEMGGFSAKNNKSIGVTAHDKIRFLAGRPVEIGFDAIIFSGENPTYIISPDTFGNAKLFSRKIKKGKQIYTFTPKKTEKSHMVMRVEEEVATYFMIKNFRVKLKTE